MSRISLLIALLSSNRRAALLTSAAVGHRLFWAIRLSDKSNNLRNCEGTMSLNRLVRQAEPEANLKTVYDAVVVGSGAAGGMAAHVLTSRGMKVLLLEAGKKLNIEKEL